MRQGGDEQFRLVTRCCQSARRRNPFKRSATGGFLFGAGFGAVSLASPRIRCSSSSSGSTGGQRTLTGGGGFGRRRRSHPDRLKDYPGLVAAQRSPLSPSLQVLPEINPIAEDPWRGQGRGGRWRVRQQGEERDSPQPEPGLSAPVLQPRGWPPLDSEAVDLEPGCMIAYRRSDPRASSQCRTQRYFRTFQATPLGHAGRGSRIWSLQAIEDVPHTSLHGHRLGIKTMCHRASPSIAAGPPPAHAGSRPTKRRSDWVATSGVIALGAGAMGGCLIIARVRSHTSNVSTEFSRSENSTWASTMASLSETPASSSAATIWPPLRK